MDDDLALCRRIEEASLNAWPAMHQVLLDGWLLRFNRGFTKRANSIIPLYPAMQPAETKVRYCENLYAREQLQTIFRLTSITDHVHLDDLLAQRRYAELDPTHVLHKPLTGKTVDTRGYSEQPLREWLQAYCSLSGIPDTASQLHEVLLKSIRTGSIFGVLRDNGEVVACGMGVVENELVGLFDIVTHPARRRTGYATRMVSALIDAGARRGATRVYLQVMEENAAARALYRTLEFESLYRYWYRTEKR